MTYAILRTKKLKSFGAVARSARHTFREQPTPNADPVHRSHNRTVGVRGVYEVLEAIKGRLPDKRRSDAVLCIEYLVTASPEAFERHGGRLDELGGGYFADALAWLRMRHGQENVISSTIHLDELTPHLVAYVVPRTKDGRLSCRDFLGGPTKLREMQDSFHAACGAAHGLERGIRGSKAKHEEVAAFYTTLTAAGKAPQLCRKDYAAAAMGIKTDAWKYAEQTAKNSAIQAAYEPRRRKANLSRSQSLEKLAAKLSLNQQAVAHRKIEHSTKEAELEQRARSLAVREKEVRAVEDKVLALEGERDALERRLEMLESFSVVREKAPFRGLNYDSAYSLS
ncbi:MobV family relaxase [Pseudomonas sp. LB3P25]